MRSDRLASMTLLIALAASSALADPGERAAAESEAAPEARIGHKSYLLPAVEVVAVHLALNAFGRWALEEDYAEVTAETMWENVDGWEWDTEGFKVNQLGHAYQGATYYTSARSSGLGGWTSFAYAVGGSVLWELFGETSSPSLNDQITTPIAGMMLGEALYQLHLRAITRLEPGFWREAASFAAAPMAGLNRAMFGERFRPADLDAQPTMYGELELGAAGLLDGGERTPGGRAAGRFVVGVPGDEGQRLSRPLGHLDVRGALNAGERTTGYVLTRGTLLGRSFGGPRGGGLFGLFGQYDYLVQLSLRTSVIGIGPGTSLARRTDSTVVGGTAIVSGIPYGSASAHPAPDESTDRHYGQGAAVTLEGFAIWGDRARLEIAGREYLIFGTIESSGFEAIASTSAALSLRIHGPHGAGLGAQWTRRMSRIGDWDVSGGEGAVFLTYQLLARGLGGPE